LQDLRVGFCLCGIEELRRSDGILKTSGHWVTMQCGHGKWATIMRLCSPYFLFDLRLWSLYEGQGGGRMPQPNAPAVHNPQCFKYLTKVFEA